MKNCVRFILAILFSSLLLASVSSAGTITVSGIFDNDATSLIGTVGHDGPGIVHMPALLSSMV